MPISASFTPSIALLCLLATAWGFAADPVPVGAARVDVTPTHPTVLAGYGGRTSEHDGVDAPIWARSLAIGGERPAVLIAVDNCGVPASMTRSVKRRIREQHRIAADRIVVCATHTHCAPSLVGYATVLWAERLSPDQQARTRRYSSWLADRLVEVATRALDARRPATLAWAQGRVEFGGNRRVLRDGRWAGFGFQRDGPVDHALPTLVARDMRGRISAVWTSYACHCTTLGARNRICGDWAGFANESIESHHDGAVALTTIGCGADVGPQPSGGIDAARRHGAAIATEIERLIASGLRPLSGAPRCRTAALRLPLAKAPDRAHFEGLAKGSGFNAVHARAMLRRIDRDGSLATSTRLPVTTWSFADDLAIVFLGGEVVVDYSLRLKRELDWRRLWINAWSDDVPGYIPSRRVLEEGGYEAEFSQIYYEQPGRYAPEVEDIVVAAVKALLGAPVLPPPDARPSPYPEPPLAAGFLDREAPPIPATTRAALTARARALIDSIRSGETGVELSTLKKRVDDGVDGYRSLVSNDGSSDIFLLFCVDRDLHPYIRQQRVGDTIRWKTAPAPRTSGKEPVTFVFAGGVGYESQPGTPGFALLLGDTEALRFDVTRTPKLWSSGRASLLFVPTWTSGEDAAGFFFVGIERSRLRAGEPLELAVRSVGSGSLRWFALDTFTTAASLARQTLDISALCWRTPQIRGLGDGDGDGIFDRSTIFTRTGGVRHGIGQPGGDDRLVGFAADEPRSLPALLSSRR